MLDLGIDLTEYHKFNLIFKSGLNLIELFDQIEDINTILEKIYSLIFSVKSETNNIKYIINALIEALKKIKFDNEEKHRTTDKVLGYLNLINSFIRTNIKLEFNNKYFVKNYNSSFKILLDILGIKRDELNEIFKNVMLMVGLFFFTDAGRAINCDKISLYIRFPKYQNGIAFSSKIPGLTHYFDSLSAGTLSLDSFEKKLKEEGKIIEEEERRIREEEEKLKIKEEKIKIIQKEEIIKKSDEQELKKKKEEELKIINKVKSEKKKEEELERMKKEIKKEEEMKRQREEELKRKKEEELKRKKEEELKRQKEEEEKLKKLEKQNLLNDKNNKNINSQNLESINSTNINNQINNLKAELDGYIKENNKLKEENTKFIDENSKLKEENNKAKDENSKLKEENTKIKEENIKLKEEIESIKSINNVSNNMLDLLNYVRNKENEIKELKAKLDKNYKIANYDEAMVINFVSVDGKINEGIICLKTDTFAEVEEKLYQKYPEYREENNIFLFGGNVVKRFKKIYENNIKNGDKVILQVESNDD